MPAQLACIVKGQGDLEAVPLRGRRGLRDDLASPADPESIRGAKEWLTSRMSADRHYVETLDLPALAAARRADSFDKLWRDVARLLARYTRLP